MPDIFISHSTNDREVAKEIQDYFFKNGASAFLAPFSIEVGTKWSNEILSNLKQARVVLFLASKVACDSPYVNQELGASLMLSKKIVPVIWDMPPENLPGWVKDYQAVDLRNGFYALRPVLDSIIKKLKLDKNREGILLMLAIGFLAWLLLKE